MPRQYCVSCWEFLALRTNVKGCVILKSILVRVHVVNKCAHHDKRRVALKCIHDPLPNIKLWCWRVTYSCTVSRVRIKTQHFPGVGTVVLASCTVQNRHYPKWDIRILASPYGDACIPVRGWRYILLGFIRGCDASPPPKRYAIM